MQPYAVLFLGAFALLTATAQAEPKKCSPGQPCEEPPPDPFYQHRIVVEPTPRDPAASGAALLAAVEGITDASRTNRYLVRLLPGTYDLGTELIMPPFVDLRGSGRETTTVTSTAPRTLLVLGDLTTNPVLHMQEVSVQNAASNGTAVWCLSGEYIFRGVQLVAADGHALESLDCHGLIRDGELRREMEGPRAVLAEVFGVLELFDVTVHGEGVQATCAFGFLGIFNSTAPRVFQEGGLLRASNSDIGSISLDAGTGIELHNVRLRPPSGIAALTMHGFVVPSAILDNVSMVALGGIGVHFRFCDVGTGTVLIRNSDITATENVLAFSNANCRAEISDSRLQGGPVAGGAFVCTNVFDGDLNPLGTDCLPQL